jgi:hypothetical protein
MREDEARERVCDVAEVSKKEIDQHSIPIPTTTLSLLRSESCVTHLAVSEDCTGGGSSVLSRVDGVGLGRSDSDD